MLRQVTVYGEIKNNETNGRTVRTFQNGERVELRSEDLRTWFMRPDSMIAAKHRKLDIPTLTDRERGWLDLVELPMAAVDSGQMKLAYQLSRRGGDL